MFQEKQKTIDHNSIVFECRCKFIKTNNNQCILFINNA